MAITEYLVTDDLTVLLGLISVSVFLLQNLYKPQPLVHPILLGRQSEAGRVRNPKESAVYRNYGTGLMGRFPLRPDKDVHFVSGFLKADFESPRTLWSTKITNAQLKERVRAFSAGLAQLLPEESNVLLLLNDGIEFLIADLAISTSSFISITLTSPKLLTRVLEDHPPSAIITDASFLPHVLELVYDARDSHHKIIVVGQQAGNMHPKSAAAAEIIGWADVEAQGAQITSTAPVRQSECKKMLLVPMLDAEGTLTGPSEPITVAFYELPTGELQGVQFSSENFTAGVTATRALFPPSNSLSSLDTIVSAHSLSTPFGRAVAYTALFEGTSFATLPSTKLFHVEEEPKNDVADLMTVTSLPIPTPTVAFLKPGHAQALGSDIVSRAKKTSWFYPLAWRHKFAGVTEGFVTKDSLWDRTVFDHARAKVMGELGSTLKTVIIGGGPLELAALTPIRIALSVPVVNVHTHATTAGPLFATQALDLQILPSDSNALAHVGAPSVNVEAKLVGVDDEVVEGGGDPVGEVLVRGPPVGTLLGSEGREEEWVSTGERGSVLTNGAFRMLAA
ncbi:hypothetical protein BJ138DRAFT_763261 [Hygrophoropsis aurantiaca]|uniref:Uncharacterized protein n=1 Tax=Hygrophoropsis aurantiaca TaxID=72124 RepID=A0ACB8ARN1_9AGAM|nr:hypothetical protein BJ138DRAFT_763261 [Hygrophoropsis aurantiaca]